MAHGSVTARAAQKCYHTVCAGNKTRAGGLRKVGAGDTAIRLPRDPPGAVRHLKCVNIGHCAVPFGKTPVAVSPQRS